MTFSALFITIFDVLCTFSFDLVTDHLTLAVSEE